MCPIAIAVCPSLSSLCSPCHHCHMHLVIIAVAPCHHCHVHLVVVVATCALLLLLPHAPCCCHHMCLIVVTMCASSSSPHVPYCYCHICLVVVALGTLSSLPHSSSMPYGSCVAARGAASASTAHLARINLTSAASSIVVAWMTWTPRVSRVRARVAMSADSPPCLLCTTGV